MSAAKIDSTRTQFVYLQARQEAEVLQAQLNVCQARITQAQQVEALIPQILTTSVSSLADCSLLITQYEAFEVFFGKLLNAMKEVANLMTGTERKTYTRNVFAVDLLKITTDCVIEYRVADRAEMIKDEVAKQYGGKLPSNVEQALTTLSARINAVPRPAD